MLLLWMSIQLIALALAAYRVPLSARFPQPAESMATAEMLVAQVAGAALLYPLLLKDASRLVMAICGLWPMLILAASLSGDLDRSVIAAGIFATGWLLALAVWRFVLVGEVAERVGLTIAILWTIGGPVLAYIHAEYGDNQNPEFWNAAAGPVAAALNHLKSADFSDDFDIIPAAILLIGFALALLRCHRLRQKSNRLST